MIDLKPLNSQLFYAIREDILSGTLQPNQKVSIEELAQRFGVSTTPVRDAIRRLESSGFLIVSPRKSVTIACLDEKAIKDVFDMRIALESLALELSIDCIPTKIIENALQANQQALDDYLNTGNVKYLEKLDYDQKYEFNIHQLLLRYCNNKKLVAVMEDIRGLIEWARGSPIGHPRSYDVAVREHMEIFIHLKTKDRMKAVEALRTHLMNSCKRTLKYWQEKS